MQVRDQKLDQYGCVSRHRSAQEVESPKAPNYSTKDIDVCFEYKRGKEVRKMTLELSRVEVNYLMQRFNEFLNDKDWKT